MINQPLHITLLGGLQVRQGDRLITRFKSQKIGALLAYLAYHLHQMHAREVLIDLFWPESILEAGRNSLSVALSTLRHQLEPPGTPARNAILRADRFSIGLNPAAVTTDVAKFEAAIAAAGKTGSVIEQTQRLTEAVDLYQGRLLPGFYEEWITAAQEQMAGLFLETVTRLIIQMEANGDLAGALGYARRAVALDPLQETAHEHLIRLLAATGQPGAALRHYKELERLLEEQVDEEPSAPLRALARQIEKQSGLTVPLPPAIAAAPRMSSPPPVQAAPSGGPVTLTFLMTDIEGSTRLWERAGDTFSQALESHHALLRREFARYGGQEINEAGDSFVVAFPSARKALDCAVTGQQALRDHTWPEEVGALRVRMALHTGDVEYREGAYHGLTLHRASRILTSGHGGQTLCSEATASLVRRDLDEAVRLVDLGIWRLRDVPIPEPLFQVEYPGMPKEAFPPLSAEEGHAARLPLRFTRFFGRDAEITRLVGMLDPVPTSDLPVRLITLIGSGGTGKTRLAIEVAERLVEPFHGAVWFAPLADLTDPRLIVDAILDSLRLPRSPQRELLEQVVEVLARQPALLVLDNFEHLVEGGTGLVQALLARVPSLQVLVTSRQLLGLSGEQEFVVPPLVTPNGGETAEQLSLYESVQLFVDRAQAAMPHFQVTSGNAPAVAELCQRLEGIPLAIELAAARALVLTPGQMLTQLEQRFGFLVSRKRDVSARHRTLHAAIDWSYRLLTPELQRFFARLSVFRGGWTVEVAEAVCEQPLALDYLAQRECSLVLVHEGRGGEGMRFRVLETLREYGREQITEAERSHVEGRHAESFLALAEAAEPKLTGAEQAVWLHRLQAEHENLRAALERSLGEERSGVGLRLCGALQRYWWTRGHLSEGREWCERALSEAGTQEWKPERAKALNGAGILARMQGDYASARANYEESLSLFREIGNRMGIATSLNGLGNVAYSQGDYVSARTYYEEGLFLQREIGNREGIAASLQAFADLVAAQGQMERAALLWGAAEALREEIGSPLSPSKREEYDRNVAADRTALGEEAFSIAWTKGRGMTMEQAVAAACREVRNQHVIE